MELVWAVMDTEDQNGLRIRIEVRLAASLVRGGPAQTRGSDDARCGRSQSVRCFDNMKTLVQCRTLLRVDSHSLPAGKPALPLSSYSRKTISRRL